MKRRYGGKATRLDNPVDSLSYKQAEILHFKELKANYWLACCPVCKWVGLSKDAISKKTAYQGLDSVGFYCEKTSMLVCPVCLKADELNEVFDPKEEDQYPDN